MLKVLFFGQLKERLKLDQVTIETSQFRHEHMTVADLRSHLQEHHSEWAEFLQHGRALVAVNQEMASEECKIRDNDEVAFFPPVTGG